MVISCKHSRLDFWSVTDLGNTLFPHSADKSVEPYGISQQIVRDSECNLP